MEAVVERLEEFSATLLRDPDFDAPELVACDTADTLLLASAAERIRAARPGSVATIGDTHGALTLGAVAVLGADGVRSFQDPLLAERALARNAERLGLGAGYAHAASWEELLSGVETVLLRLPRGLEALDEIAWSIARYAHPDVRVFAGGRVKHMTPAQNVVLARHFGEVIAGLGWRKSRVVQATARLAASPSAESPFPKWARDSALPFALAAFGATFGGAKLDHGSRLLLSTLAGQGQGQAQGSEDPERILDLGCGNGVLAVSAALAWPNASVVATDQSAAAVRSTALTAEAAGVADRVTIHRADGAEAVPERWADLVLLNPPFHTGSTVHVGVGHRLVRDAARVLRPGGELRIVFNSHLSYRSVLTAAVGPAEQLARDATFTVLSATLR